ncbi:MAG: cyclic nucleotide-binding domain-containing protein [Candidatus Neomarinimicrobiota bacterium]
MKFPYQLLQIKSSEGTRVFRFFLCFFLLISALVVGRTARDTFFLSRFSPDYLPHVFIAVAVVVGAAVSFYTRMASRFAMIPTVLATYGIASLSLIVLQFFLKLPGVYALLYVWMEVISTLTTIQFWLLASRAFTTREAKRLFGIIGSGGAVASTAIGFSIRPFVHTWGTDYLLMISAGFILASFGMIYTLRPFISGLSIPRTKRHQEERASRHPFRNPYLRTLTLTVGISTLVATLVDYQLKIIASESLNEASLASLFGSLYGIIGVASILMQFLVTGRLLSRFGILWGLMLLPAALVTGNIMLLISPVILSAIITRAGDQIFRYTVHGSASQLLWLPVPAGETGRAKPFIEGTMKNSAQALSGFLIIGMMTFLDVRFLSVPSLLLLIVWILANFKLRDGYLTQLQKAIEKRSLDFVSLEIDVTDPLIVKTVRKAIMEGDDHQRLFALDSIKDLSLSPWSADLRKVFPGTSPIVQKKILELARRNSDAVSDEDILSLMHSEDDGVAAEAMVACGERELTHGLPALRDMLSSNIHRRRSGAAAGILLMGVNNASRANSILKSMLYDPNNDIQIAALQSVGHIPAIVSDKGLATLLEDDSTDVRNLAIGLAAQRGNPLLIPSLVNNLGDPATMFSARDALRSFDPDEVTSTLIERLPETRASTALTAGIIRALGKFGRGPSVDPVIRMLNDGEETVTEEIVNALVKISRREGLTEDQLTDIETVRDGFIQSSHTHAALLSRFTGNDSAILIKDHLLVTLEKQRKWILKLSLLRFPDSPVETFLHRLSSGDLRARANVLEMLDNLMSHDDRERILPLFDDAPSQDRISHIQVSLEQTLAEWLRSGNEWISVIALDYVLRNKMVHILELSEWEHESDWMRSSDSMLHKEVMTQDWNRQESSLRQMPDFQWEKLILKEMPMYSTLEKTIFMKGVALFQEISGEEVARVAQISEERRLSAGESVFDEGDVGDSMFIIMNGQIRVHKSREKSGTQKEVAVLSRGEFVGEMALLDQEPRSASASALEETVLLGIHGEDFYDLMASRVEIMQGIVRVLTRRLREAIA